MLASSQGGINIEEVAVESPELLLAEPVDILTGLHPDQAVKVATFMGFEGERIDQVSNSTFEELHVWSYVCERRFSEHRI
jgi:succinyl-CoA synthetase beta subunit